MRVFGTRQHDKTAFRAHFYKGSLSKENLRITKVITDNNPNLGNNPELIITDGCGFEDGRFIELEDAAPIPMEKTENGNFVAEIHSLVGGYKIFYRDTGLTDDNNGKNYDLSRNRVEELNRQAIIASKIAHNHPLTSIISAGKTDGKLVVCDDISNLPKDFDTETPTILLSRKNKHCNPYNIPNNVVGIILEQGMAGMLYHYNSSLRNAFGVIAITYDEKEIEKLEALNNQFITFSTLDNKISCNKIDSLEDITKKAPIAIEVPQMRYIDTLVDSKEYTKDTVGAKAYNLRVMEELVAKGVLKDVKIPRSFAITHGFIEKMYELINKSGNKSPKTVLSYIKEIENKIRESGFDENDLMFRSSFNGEDIENYSAAGLYESTWSDIQGIYFDLIFVVNSKYSDKAVSSRKAHGIPDDAIKPTVIVQERISPDYAFTVYTKDPTKDEDILTINMNLECTSDDKDPFILEYNKKDKTLKIVALERDAEDFIFDEQDNIVSSSHDKDKAMKALSEKREILEKVIENALELEKYFGTAQDIEGGIKGDEIYFWQTRNVVKNS